MYYQDVIFKKPIYSVWKVWDANAHINCAGHTVCLAHCVPGTVPGQGGVILYSAILR